MRLTRQKRKKIFQVLDMAPMIDVVMLLLIFFMCTATFVQPEESVNAQIARAEGFLPQDEERFEPIEIRLCQTDDGVVIYCDANTCSTFEELGRVLARKRQISEIDVIVKGQGNILFGDMVSAVNTCYSANFLNVAFSTIESF